MEKDGEAGRSSQDVESGREGISHWKMIFDQGVTTKEIEEYDYEGEGTEDDPYVVEWIENDPRNPMVCGRNCHVDIAQYSHSLDMGEDEEMDHSYCRGKLGPGRIVLFICVLWRHSANHDGV